MEIEKLILKSVMITNKFYAGIGSRKTPAPILQLMTNIARKLSNENYVLRSGGAEGADTAFDKGAIKAEIFLPWNGFNGHYVDHERYFYVENHEADKFARKYHPNGSNLSSPVLKLMKRNCFQVLGPKLNDPADFILCWTEEGSGKGGTGQAIRIANDYNIPVYDFGIETIRKRFIKL